jgi:hypothetical protein
MFRTDRSECQVRIVRVSTARFGVDKAANSGDNRQCLGPPNAPQDIEVDCIA